MRQPATDALNKGSGKFDVRNGEVDMVGMEDCEFWIISYNSKDGLHRRDGLRPRIQDDGEEEHAERVTLSDGQIAMHGKTDANSERVLNEELHEVSQDSGGNGNGQPLEGSHGQSTLPAYLIETFPNVGIKATEAPFLHLRVLKASARGIPRVREMKR